MAVPKLVNEQFWEIGGAKGNGRIKEVTVQQARVEENEGVAIFNCQCRVRRRLRGS